MGHMIKYNRLRVFVEHRMDDKMKKILWISPYAPYDKVDHAGGKVHNFYVKYFHKSGKFDITLLSLCLKREESLLDLEQYGVKNHIFVMDKSKIKKFERRAKSAWSFINPFDKYAGICLDYERYHIEKMLMEYIREGNKPDIVIMQWTFSLAFIEIIRKKFPSCKLIAIEEDVTFLGYERKWKKAESSYQKFFWKTRYERIKVLELNWLKKVDLIVTNNPKDTALLVENNIPEKKIFTSMPYFDDYSKVIRQVKGRDLLFFGAMSRAENYLSAIWFIDNVMPKIQELNTRFLIAGSSPPDILKEKESESVKILGYVEDMTEYFSSCVCLVAPLKLGAGIKIKILEAMSAGIPVLTNEIGIEGIEAVDGKEYILCSSSEEYADSIKKLLSNYNLEEFLSSNSKAFIKKKYHMASRLDKLIYIIENELSDKENYIR